MTDATRIRGVASAPKIDPVDPARQADRQREAARAAHNPANPSFAELLRARQGVASALPGTDANAVRFSAHAQTRLQSRQIALQPDHIARLEAAVGRAAAKGGKDALVLMDDLALVVSVPNRTVVTVVDKANLKQNVFTNIDSAVIA